MPIPPIAAPKPRATDAESSPSIFNAASIIIIASILLLSTIFCNASSGLPTVEPGPSALTRNNFLCS